MKILLLLPFLLGFLVPANATSDLHPLDMKLEQKVFSSLIASEVSVVDTCEGDEDVERDERGDPVPEQDCEG